MPIERLNIVQIDSKKIEHSIYRLSFVKKNRDLYLIDKSIDNFHISIHKDGNVSMTFQKDWQEKDNIRIFKFNWDLLDIEKEKEKPLFLYIPAPKKTYPVENKTKSKSATLYLNEIEDLHTIMFKYFIINQDAEKPKSRSADLGIKVSRIQGKKDNGQIVDKQLEEYNPSLRFDNHRIRFSLGQVDKLKENINYRMLFLFQPTTKIDMNFFIKNNVFKVDTEHIKKIGFFLKKYKTKESHEIVLLAY
jgi:hypothetical protein